MARGDKFSGRVFWVKTPFKNKKTRRPWKISLIAQMQTQAHKWRQNVFLNTRLVLQIELFTSFVLNGKGVIRKV